MRQLLSGIAGTGKTRRVLEVIQDYLARGEGPKLLVLLPTESLVSHFKALLLSQGTLEGFVDDFLFTFHGLSYFWASQKKNFTLARPHQKILILEEVLKKNCPAYFAGVKDYPGFRQSLLNSFRELKERQIDPALIDRQALTFAGQWSGKSLDRLQALAQIYQAYQKALREKGWWDAEDLLVAASDLIQEDPSLSEGKELLILDGFYSFTSPEKKLLTLLLERIPQTLITLTIDSKSSGLFEPSQETLKFLTAYNLNQKFLEQPRRFQAPALGRIAESFLRNHSRAVPAEEPESLKIWAAPDRSTEVEAVAQEILSLVHGENFAFADIGIILRQPSLYLNLFREAFTRLNIPWRYWGKEVLAAHPWVKTALHLGKLFSLGWERERVFRLLKSGYFDLDLPAVDNLEQAAQELPLAEAKEWRSFLTPRINLVKESQPSAVLNLLGRLLDCSAQFQGKAEGPAWAQKYRELLEELLRGGAVRLASREEGTLPLLGVETFLATVEEVGALRAQDKITFADFHHALTLAANSRQIFLPDLRRQAVNLISVHEARQWELPVVLVVGLVEGEFPDAAREDLFLKDRQRQELKLKGAINLPLFSASREEELLFYFAATRASQRLYLTYPTGGAPRKELLPSSFIEEIKALFSPQIREKLVTPLPPPWEPPPREKIYSPQALSLYALAKKDEASREGQVARWVLAQDTRHPWPRILALPRYQQSLTIPLSEELRGPDFIYSVSELEIFAQCPLAYFYQYILGLKSLVLTYSEDLEYSFWGTLAHRTLELYYRRRPGPSGNGQDQDISSLLEEVLARHPEQIPSTYSALREKEFLKRYLAQYLEREKARSPHYPFHPEKLEWTFGKDTQPLTIETAGEPPIRLSGKLDRLDVGEKDKSYALVIDYKYSRLKKKLKERIESGQGLQLPIYLLAARELLGYQPAGGLLYYLKIIEKPEAFEDLAAIGQKNLWPSNFGGKKVRLYDQAEWQEMMREVKEGVEELVTRLQRGDIRATPKKDEYCGPKKCQFYDLCPTRERESPHEESAGNELD